MEWSNSGSAAGITAVAASAAAARSLNKFLLLRGGVVEGSDEVVTRSGSKEKNDSCQTQC